MLVVMEIVFRAISHQLFQNPNFHQIVRSTAIDYIRSHEEQFVESIATHFLHMLIVSQ